MLRDEIAPPGLREIVDRWRVEGLPEPVKVEAMMASLDEGQQQKLGAFADAVEEYRACRIGGYPEAGSEEHRVLERLRFAVQQAIIAGIADAGCGPILRGMENCGAVPIVKSQYPDKNWAYWIMPDGRLACWECGEPIIVKQITSSVWNDDGPGPCAGDGKVVSAKVPYCPKCDDEPQNGIVHATAADEIAADMEGIVR